MVTYYDGHWDNVRNNETYYWKRMIKPRIESLIEKTPTIFIKTDKDTRTPQKSWEGYVEAFKDGVRAGESSVIFRFHLNREIPIPEVYHNYRAGWYEIGGEVAHLQTNPLEPPFFNILQTTDDKDEFEILTFQLLKVLGIHEVFRYPPADQAGRADGFFQFGHVSVLYDCTLRYQFESKKGDQVENFISQLESGRVKYEMWDYKVSDTYNYVWVVTKGASRTLRVTRNATAKEVPVGKLIGLYSKRVNENLDTQSFESALRAV